MYFVLGSIPKNQNFKMKKQNHQYFRKKNTSGLLSWSEVRKTVYELITKITKELVNQTIKQPGKTIRAKPNNTLEEYATHHT